MVSLAVIHLSEKNQTKPSEWRRNTLFYYVMFSHWFSFPFKMLCSGHLADLHLLWICYWIKQGRLLKRLKLFSVLLNLKDIHIQVFHSSDKLCRKEKQDGSCSMWIYQCLFTVSRTCKISQMRTWVSETLLKKLSHTKTRLPKLC